MLRISILSCLILSVACQKNTVEEKPAEKPVKHTQTAEAKPAPKPETVKKVEATAPAKIDVKKAGEALGLKAGQKLMATFETSLGNIDVELFWEKAPNTVVNFVQLAEGSREWVEEATNQKVKKPLYNGTIFHRVIPGFMIQGGDPMGNGRGGPGYKFEDEFDDSLKHDAPGILSMANAGPNTNGSQFFITDAPTPHLNNRHSVFGKADEKSLTIVTKIANVEKVRPGSSKPKTDVTLKSVKITRPTS